MTRSADMGTGATFVYTGDSAFEAKVFNYSFTGYERGIIDSTHLGSIKYITSIPQDLENPGGIDMEIAFDETVDVTTILDDPPGSLLITFPIHTLSGDTAGATFEGSGFWSTFDNTVPNEDKSTASAHWEWDGKDGPTYTAGS